MITLIDTSAWIEALKAKGKEVVKSKVKDFLISGEARISEPILLELYNGARGTKELNLIEELENTIPILTCNKEIFSESNLIAIKLRSKGVTVPSVDILIFTISKVYKANLYHQDSDFSLIESKIIN